MTQRKWRNAGIRPLPNVAPETDAHAEHQDTPAFQEAMRLAWRFELGYLSVSGVHKLSLLIREVRTNRPSFDFLNAPLFVVTETEMSKLLILSCSDALLWYAQHIGYMAPLLRDLPDEQCWLVREPSGFSNILRYRDAVPVPEGYALAEPDLLIQPNDLLLHGRKWLQASVDLWGQPAATRSVIRRHSTPQP